MKILGRKTIAIILIILLSFMEFKFLHWYFFEIKEIDINDENIKNSIDDKYKTIITTHITIEDYSLNNYPEVDQIIDKIQEEIEKKTGKHISGGDIYENLSGKDNNNNNGYVDTGDEWYYYNPKELIEVKVIID